MNFYPKKSDGLKIKKSCGVRLDLASRENHGFDCV